MTFWLQTVHGSILLAVVRQQVNITKYLIPFGEFKSTSYNNCLVFLHSMLVITLKNLYIK